MRRVTWQCSALRSLLLRAQRLRAPRPFADGRDLDPSPALAESVKGDEPWPPTGSNGPMLPRRETDVNCVDSSFGEWPRADRIWLNWRRLPGTEPSTPPSRSHDGTRWLGKPGRFLRPGHYPLVSANSPGLRRGYFAADQSGQKLLEPGRRQLGVKEDK